MRNLILILLTILIVITGVFLPGLLLKNASAPEIKLDYQEVNITSETSSDFPWRMARMGDNYYGDNPNLLRTFISREEEDGVEPTEESLERREPFLKELQLLADRKVISQELVDALGEIEAFSVSYYYLFDSAAVSGFRIAEYHISDRGWEFSATIDVESGKLGRIYSSGRHFGYRSNFTAESASWYDVVRHYADYLGMSQTAFTAEGESSPLQGYHDKITADRLAATISGTDWLEVRAMSENASVTLCVYRGGK